MVKDESKAVLTDCVEIDYRDDTLGRGRSTICEDVEKIETINNENKEKLILITFANGDKFEEKIGNLDAITFKQIKVVKKQKK